mmetsp:Transcript_2398/g.11691  ORF Transcript_2398/g.11691 Transcript_2398/m.11691 type:complete len:200 (+) Transcript_2398:4657-5256(+)
MIITSRYWSTNCSLLTAGTVSLNSECDLNPTVAAYLEKSGEKRLSGLSIPGTGSISSSFQSPESGYSARILATNAASSASSSFSICLCSSVTLIRPVRISCVALLPAAMSVELTTLRLPSASAATPSRTASWIAARDSGAILPSCPRFNAASASASFGPDSCAMASSSSVFHLRRTSSSTLARLCASKYSRTVASPSSS